MPEADYQSMIRNAWSRNPLHGRVPAMDASVDAEMARIADAETADIRAACRKAVESGNADWATLKAEVRAAHLKAETSIRTFQQSMERKGDKAK